MIRKQTVSIVCPCFNEAAGIERFHEMLSDALEACPEYAFRLVFVDDGSSDATLERLRAIQQGDPRARVLALSRNFGHQIAVTAGLDAAEGDAVIVMDSDLQHPPGLLREMIRQWAEHEYDVVWGVRRCSEGAGFFKRCTSGLFYRLINAVSDTHIIPNAADFYLLSRRARNALCSMPERHRFLRGMLTWIGYRRTTVAFDAPERFAGQSKYTLRKMLKLAFDAAFSFSTTPIRMAVRLGLFIVAAGMGYLAYILGLYFLGAQFEGGWSSLICTLLILGGAQLTFIGLIGEYVARVFEESKGRPLYFADEYRPHSGEPNRAATVLNRDAEVHP